MKDFTVRPIRADEIETVADFISRGYYDDIYFHWVVGKEEDRHQVVKDYYIIYLGAKGSVGHVAETSDGVLVGASVWLPHDLDPSVSEKVYEAAGVYAKNFKQVSAKSYDSCPPMEPFYELVAVVTDKKMQGKGIGGALLKYHLDILDEAGISTYLEASTPYHGDGVYAKFGYQQTGELLVFADTAVLYPLWRPAKKPKKTVKFGGYDWLVLEERDDEMLLLSKEIIEPASFHNVFEDISWEDSDIRRHLNTVFHRRFSLDERMQILEKAVYNEENPWYSSQSSNDALDKFFLLTIKEVVKYFGDSGQLKNPKNRFFIDDIYNDDRKATFADGSPSRWLLCTSGNYQNLVANVTVEGKILVTGDFVNRASTELFNVGMRPAMWLKKGGLA